MEESTAEQIQAVWGAGFTAQAGTYGIGGDVAIRVPTVAKGTGPMAPGAFSAERVRIVGDTLFSTGHSNQAGPATAPMTGKYLRVRARMAPTN